VGTREALTRLSEGGSGGGAVQRTLFLMRWVGLIRPLRNRFPGYLLTILKVARVAVDLLPAASVASATSR
jgi:hypothetical protein